MWIVFGAALITGAALTWVEVASREIPAVVWFNGDGRKEAAELGSGVYLARKRDTPEVKVGWTGRVAGTRIGEWETGTSAPVDLEGFIPTTDKRVERAVHRALRKRGWHQHDEWFAVPDGWRPVVEAAVA